MGNYLWLGGAWDQNSESWCWNDASPVGLPDTGETNWDNNQGKPGHGPDEPYFGLKRSNGKWHDFHGKWSERNPGMIALCQGYTEYWCWNDGSQIGLPDTGETNWDNNQGKPGHAPNEPYFGLKRSNGKWHDFHGKWNERNPGMI